MLYKSIQPADKYEFEIPNIKFGATDTGCGCCTYTRPLTRENLAKYIARLRADLAKAEALLSEDLPTNEEVDRAYEALPD